MVRENRRKALKFSNFHRLVLGGTPHFPTHHGQNGGHLPLHSGRSRVMGRSPRGAPQRFGPTPPSPQTSVPTAPAPVEGTGVPMMSALTARTVAGYLRCVG